MALCQWRTRLAKRTMSPRSCALKVGRVIDRAATMSCWRRSAFSPAGDFPGSSAMSSSRDRNASSTSPTRTDVGRVAARATECTPSHHAGDDAFSPASKRGQRDRGLSTRLGFHHPQGAEVARSRRDLVLLGFGLHGFQPTLQSDEPLPRFRGTGGQRRANLAQRNKDGGALCDRQPLDPHPQAALARGRGLKTRHFLSTEFLHGV